MTDYACKCCAGFCVYLYEISWVCAPTNQWGTPTLISTFCGTSEGHPVNEWFIPAGGTYCTQRKYVLTADACSVSGDCPAAPGAGSNPTTLTPDQQAYCCCDYHCYAKFTARRNCTTNVTTLDDGFTKICLNVRPPINTWTIDANGETECTWLYYVDLGVCCPASDSDCPEPSIGQYPHTLPTKHEGCDCCPSTHRCIYTWIATYEKATGKWTGPTPFSATCADPGDYTEGWRRLTQGDTFCTYEYTQVSGDCCTGQPGDCKIADDKPAFPDLGGTGWDGNPLTCGSCPTNCSTCDLFGGPYLYASVSSSTGGLLDGTYCAHRAGTGCSVSGDFTIECFPADNTYPGVTDAGPYWKLTLGGSTWIQGATGACPPNGPWGAAIAGDTAAQLSLGYSAVPC